MRWIRNRILLLALLSLIAVSGMAAVPVFGQGEDLTVGVPVDRCPVFYLDPESGEIAEIGADLMREAAGEALFRVSLRAIEEDSLKEAAD